MTLATADPRSTFDRASSGRLRRLAGLFGALTLVTYGLIVLGALVRAHGAGLACPDWPLCFGQAIPEFNVKIGFEVGHRYLAGLISLAFVALCAACYREPAAWRVCARTVFLAAALLALQIVLGGLTVLHLLASWTVTSHLLVGNAFALALLFAHRALLEASRESAPVAASPGPVRGVVFATALLLCAQMVLGGLVSSNYAGLVCPEWPTCHEGQWFPDFAGPRAYHLLHRLCAYGLISLLAAGVWLARRDLRSRALLRAALLVCVAQVGAGVANVLLRLPVEITGLHSALAATLVALTGLLVRASLMSPSEGADPVGTGRATASPAAEC